MEGKGKEGKGADAREDAPVALSNFPPCMTSDRWAPVGEDLSSSHGHILRAIEARHGAFSPADVGALGAKVSASCPEGCTRDISHECAQLLIDKIAKAGSLRVAGDWYAKDRRGR